MKQNISFILDFLKKNKISLLVSSFYFLILLPFYLKIYEVPDFFVYRLWGQEHLYAKDGCSTTFILITRLCTSNPHLIQILSLLLMSLALFFFLSVQEKIKEKLLKVLYILFVISLGSFWYFYGKTFYDFPFICLIVSIIYKLSLSEKCSKLIMYLLAGLTLSFKPFAIYALWPVYVLLLIYKKEFLNEIKSFKKMLLNIGFFVIGYLIGMWGLLTHSSKTIKGITSCIGKSNIIEHLFSNSRMPWDHIANYSVNLGTCNIITVIGIFIVTVCFIKNKNKYWLLLSNIFICLMYYVFIKFFSSGLVFHSFPFSLYLICLLGYILIFEAENFSKLQKYAVLFFVVVQFLNNFAIYLPKETKNFILTDRAYKELDKQKEEITQKIYEHTNKKDKIEIAYNLQRRDVKTGYYIHERAKNYDLILPYVAEKPNYNKLFFVEHQNFHDTQNVLQIGYFYNIPSEYNRDFLCPREAFVSDLKEIYSKNNIKIYMKKVKNDTFEKCIY